MINFYKLAAFSADFPDDWVMEGDEVVEFPGRAVATAIAALLRAKGYAVSDPEHQGENGWDFAVDHGKASIWVLVTSFEAGRFILQHGSRARSLMQHREPYAEVMQALNDALNGDGRFGDVLWCDVFGAAEGFANPRVETPGNEKRPFPEAW